MRAGLPGEHQWKSTSLETQGATASTLETQKAAVRTMETPEATVSTPETAAETRLLHAAATLEASLGA